MVELIHFFILISVNSNVATYLLCICSQFFYLAYRRDSYNNYFYTDQSHIYKISLLLKYHYNIRCLYLIDIVCADYPHSKMRFFLSYNFYSITYNSRFLISCFLDNFSSIVSITNIFPVSNWMEREVYDLFGLRFQSHPDMRRILTDYGFKGHPLKKDYPLTGYTEVHYDALYQCVMSNKVNLIHYFRNFSFDSVWEFNYL